MSKVGRKPKSNSITKKGRRQTFCIRPNLIKRLDRYCAANRLVKSDLVNSLLEKFIASTKNGSSSPAPYRVISLFSGCGGMDLGFLGNFVFLGRHYRDFGFEIVFSNDIMPAAAETHRANFKNKIHLCDIKEYLDKGGYLPDCEVVTGGFPCQDFSVAGKRKGLSSDRGRLYEQMKRVIELKKPLIFIAENVKGLTNLKGALEKMKSDFSSMKPEYEVHHYLKMAADFGVPQTRERVFIVGTRKDLGVSFVPPMETNSAAKSEARSSWVTAKDAIGDLESVSTSFANHDQISRAKMYGEHLQGNKPIKADYPGPTIRAQHHGNIEFHYNQPRRLTVRECARIQSFPDNFYFASSGSKNYVVIGNAVPPVLAWHLAKSTKEFLDHVFEKKRSKNNKQNHVENSIKKHKSRTSVRKSPLGKKLKVQKTL